MAKGRDSTKSDSLEQDAYRSNNINNCQTCSESSNNDPENRQNANGNPFDYADGPRYPPKRRYKDKSFSMKGKIHRSLSSATSTSLALVRKNPGCSLANIFMLRILFWDILISCGDVVTDFLRVSLIFYKTCYYEFWMMLYFCDYNINCCVIVY